MTSRVLTENFKSTNVRDKESISRRTPMLLSLVWRLAPGLTGRLIKNSFFSPAVPKLGTLEKQYLETGRKFYIRVHGKKIQCWQWGEGPGILFVHGWNGRGVQFSHFFKAILKSGYSVITYDGPAHGESQGKTTNYFELSDTVRAFFNRVENFNIQGVIAHSIGASAVINCLAREKPDVETVLIAPALQLGEILFNAFSLHGVPRKIYQKLIADLEKQYGYSLFRDSPHLLARQISSRVLIVHDKDDRTTFYKDSEKLAAINEHVVLHTTTGLGHKRILHNPGIVDLILAYIGERCDRARVSQQGV